MIKVRYKVGDRGGEIEVDSGMSNNSIAGKCADHYRSSGFHCQFCGHGDVIEMNIEKDGVESFNAEIEIESTHSIGIFTGKQSKVEK